MRRKAHPEQTETKTPQTKPVTQESTKLKRVVKNTREEFLEPIVEETAPLTTLQLAPPVSEDDEPDDLQGFFDGLDAEQSLRLKIDQLTEYHLTGKTGRNAPFTFCGEIPVSVDFLTSEQYLSYTQDTQGGGAFRFTLKDPSAGFLRWWVKTINAPMKQANGSQSPSMPVYLQQPVAPTPEPQKTFIQQLDEYSKIAKSLSLIANPNGLPVAPATPPAPPVMPLEEEVTRAVIREVFLSGDEALKKDAISHFLGGAKEPSTWDKVAEKAIDAIAPAIAPLASFLVQRFLAGTPQTAANQTVDVTAQPSEPVPPVQRLPEPSKAQKLVAIVRDACLFNESVTATASAFDWLTTEENRDELAAIFTLPPEKVLEVLHIEVLTERVGWMAALQRELQDEEESEPEVVQ